MQPLKATATPSASSAIGWAPLAERSMMLNLRCPRATHPSFHSPDPSGPRDWSAAVISATARMSARLPSKRASPLMPHMSATTFVVAARLDARPVVEGPHGLLGDVPEHAGKVAVDSEAPALPGGARPGRAQMRQGRLDETEVAVAFQRRAYLGQQPVDQFPRRPLGAGGHVEQVAVETVAGGAPVGGGQEPVRYVWRRGADPQIVQQSDHQRADQSGNEDGVGNGGADVPDPNLHGRVPHRWSGVPVDHCVVEHRAARDQVTYRPLVVPHVAQVRGGAGARPARPQNRAPTGVAGVPAGVERRVRRHRLQHRKPRPQQVAHLHGTFPVGDTDVDVAAAQPRGVRQRAERGGHRPVARLVAHRWPLGGRQQRGADGERPQSEVRGGAGGGFAKREKGTAQVGKAAADGAGSLDLGGVELAAEVLQEFAGQRIQYRFGTAAHPTGCGIDQQKLLLDPDGGQRRRKYPGTGRAKRRQAHRLAPPAGPGWEVNESALSDSMAVPFGRSPAMPRQRKVKPAARRTGRPPPARRRRGDIGPRPAVDAFRRGYGTRMNHDRVPVLEAIEQFRREDTYTFALPGHRRGRGIDDRTAGVLSRGAFRADVITAKQAVPDAEELMADAVGARQAVFTTCGSSISIHTAVLTITGPGRTVLVDRNVHKSVLASLILAGAHPVWLRPRWDHENQIAHPAAADDVAAALDRHPEASAVVIITPTAYRTGADVHGIADICHRHGVPLLVDEAWGAHFPFHPDLPPAAVRAGGDLAVQSLHRAVGGLCQSSMILVGGDLVDPVDLRLRLDLITTTSPSALMYGSIDGWRRHLALNGRELIDGALHRADHIRRRLRKNPDLSVIDESIH